MMGAVNGTRPVSSLAVALVALVAVIIAAPGCKPNFPYVWAKDVAATEVPVTSMPLQPGDQIIVQVTNMAELGTEPFTVNADGTINLPLVGAIEVEGLTPAAAAAKVNGRLNGIIVQPDARISIVNPRTPVVVVIGEVQEPGRYEIDQGEVLLTTLARARGLTEFANDDKIFVVRQAPKLQRIRFRYDDLTGGVERSADFRVRDGDVIVVE